MKRMKQAIELRLELNLETEVKEMLKYFVFDNVNFFTFFETLAEARAEVVNRLNEIKKEGGEFDAEFDSEFDSDYLDLGGLCYGEMKGFATLLPDGTYSIKSINP
jgi:hypothetical protein